MPTPRSPRAMTLSIAPSLISTEPDCASRRKTSPVATPSERSASSAVATVASFVSRALTCSTSFQFPADNDRGDADGRLRVGYRRSLSVLTAGAGGVAKIAPDHGDLAHELRALADERRSAEWLRELTVANPVALGDFEGEVARNHVDLPTAHLLYEDAIFDGTQDLRRIRPPARDHRVRHPADREVTEGLASPVPAPRDAELLGMLSVREVGAKDAVLDEDRAVRRRAFVIHRRRAALVGIGPVVDHRDELARDLLPNAT